MECQQEKKKAPGYTKWEWVAVHQLRTMEEKNDFVGTSCPGECCEEPSMAAKGTDWIPFGVYRVLLVTKDEQRRGSQYFIRRKLVAF